jgi:hypothetical protein
MTYTQSAADLLSAPDDKLPYPELFDRTERTFAATFAKFGDLTYFTPVQRIGAYMDFTARLQKRHLTDLIAYLKTAKAGPKAVVDEDLAAHELGLQEYLEHCLFVGAMPLEELETQEGHNGDEQEQALSRVFEFPAGDLVDENQFKFNAVWSR